jgi:hypothetical protein
MRDRHAGTKGGEGPKFVEAELSDLLTPDRMRLDPPIPANTYHDSFGNFCHVIRTPPGRLTVSADFLIQDKGEPDATASQAEQRAP